MILYRDAHFTVEQVVQPAIPGYLIIRPVQTVRSLADLSPEALTRFGPVLAKGMAAIDQVVGPERIYVIRLGEEVEAIHFHLFPRTRAMIDLYRQLHPTQPTASGAVLFDWARRPDVVAQITLTDAIAETAECLKTHLQKS